MIPAASIIVAFTPWKPVTETSLNPELQKEVSQRRTFAIISHPDAGKTTLTEKLLMYGGAIQEAGAVKARRATRHATSDWLEIEKQRGEPFTRIVYDAADRTVGVLGIAAVALGMV